MYPEYTKNRLMMKHKKLLVTNALSKLYFFMMIKNTNHKAMTNPPKSIPDVLLLAKVMMSVGEFALVRLVKLYIFSLS